MEIVRRLFRGRLDGNEEERRNSFELTPSRFKRGGPLSLSFSLRSAVCTRYGSRTCIIGPNCFLARNRHRASSTRPPLLRTGASTFLSPRFITDRSRERPVNFISRIMISFDRDPK